MLSAISMTAADLSDDNLALLEAKLKADLETVQKVRALMREHLDGIRALAMAGPLSGVSAPAVPVPPAPLQPQAPLPPPALVARVTRPDVKTAVREVVGEFTGHFKIGDVKNALHARQWAGHPDTSIRAVLMRLVQTGEIRVVKAAVGRAGSTLERTDNWVQPQKSE